jgi:hypothetical protein
MGLDVYVLLLHFIPWQKFRFTITHSLALLLMGLHVDCFSTPHRCLLQTLITYKSLLWLQIKLTSDSKAFATKQEEFIAKLDWGYRSHSHWIEYKEVMATNPSCNWQAKEKSISHCLLWCQVFYLKSFYILHFN